MKGFDEFVRELPDQTVESVRNATVKFSNIRRTVLPLMFKDVDAARQHAAAVKDYTLDNLKTLLVQFERRCQENGVTVHWARDSEEARSIITKVCQAHAQDGATIVKAKSMATEEIHLNEALIEAGYDVVETDLGEFVIQLDHDTPSHIVAPIIHKDRIQVGRAFQRAGIGGLSSEPEVLAAEARAYLRSKFQVAEVGISGVNFGIAETGRIVLVENEGNNRLSTTAPKTHIAVMGIEKLLPRESDLPLFLKLLAGSATGQRLTVYTHLIRGPRRAGEVDGPDRVHLVLLDNGRSRVVSGPYRSILRCIRCGACLNTCPVYRQSSGHAYGHVYSGPVGAVLAPALEGVSAMGHLAKASTLCGECEEVCPVAIPIPEMLLRLRAEWTDAGHAGSTLQWKGLDLASANSRRWAMSLRLLPMATKLPNPWSQHRANPMRLGREFRRWWRERT